MLGRPSVKKITLSGRMEATLPSGLRSIRFQASSQFVHAPVFIADSRLECRDVGRVEHVEVASPRVGAGARRSAVWLNATISSFPGKLPSKALMNSMIPARTPFVEREVGVDRRRLVDDQAVVPPQRVRGAVNVGGPLMSFVLRPVLRSVPPALKLNVFVPPPAPAMSPPPLMVTSTRRAFFVVKPGSVIAALAEVVSFAARALVTLMTHVGESTPGVNGTPGGGRRARGVPRSNCSRPHRARWEVWRWAGR